MTLAEVRRRLRRTMAENGNGGFEFYSIHGAQHAHVEPHIRVRVELRVIPRSGGKRYKFFVFVDYHLPLGVEPDDAREFTRVAKQALRRAEWAEKLTEGLEWDHENLWK